MATGNRIAWPLLAAAGWMSAGCGAADDERLTDETLGEAAHWSYLGDHGPERWGEIDVDFAMCATGTQQSPIDIPSSIAPGEFTALSFDYAPAPAAMVDNGHTIQVNLTEGANVLDVDGDTYALVQFHFHAHSEHSVDGVFTPLELHLVHRAENGDLAAVGVFLDLGAPNTPLSPVFDGIPTASLEPTPLAADLDPSDLLPTSRRGWGYTGSLTTPPCTEGVRWHVMSTPLQLSAAQLDAFTARHEINRRPVKQYSGTVTSGSSPQLL